MNRFVNSLNWAPQDMENPDVWKLEEDLGYVYKKYLIIMKKGVEVDGASIPRFLWRLLGHPFEGANAWYSLPHDYIYNNTMLIIDLRTTALLPEALMDCWHVFEDNFFISNRQHFDREFADDVLLSAMKVMNENRFKKWMVYRGLRMFGWFAWGKAHS